VFGHFRLFVGLFVCSIGSDWIGCAAIVSNNNNYSGLSGGRGMYGSIGSMGRTKGFLDVFSASNATTTIYGVSPTLDLVVCVCV
jgi:hypothetical protein